MWPSIVQPWTGADGPTLGPGHAWGMTCVCPSLLDTSAGFMELRRLETDTAAEGAGGCSLPPQQGNAMTVFDAPALWDAPAD